MAIQTLSFISLILRPYVKQPISTDGWKTLFAQVDPHRNFDGELMAFGAMSGQDIDRIIHDLTSFGYIGPDQRRPIRHGGVGYVLRHKQYSVLDRASGC